MPEDVRKLMKRGLISRKAYRKGKFAKRAGHNPPKPEFADKQALNLTSPGVTHYGKGTPYQLPPPPANINPSPRQIGPANENVKKLSENESVLETVSRPVAAVARRIGKSLGQSDKPKAATSATLGIRG